MSLDSVCERHTLRPLRLASGRIYRCLECRGVWIERAAALHLFGGQPYTYEAPVADGPRCGMCRQGVGWLSFFGQAPVMLCTEHGMWLEQSDRALLPDWLERKLRRLEAARAAFFWLCDVLDTVTPEAGDYEERSDSSSDNWSDSSSDSSSDDSS